MQQDRNILRTQQAVGEVVARHQCGHTPTAGGRNPQTAAANGLPEEKGDGHGLGCVGHAAVTLGDVPYPTLQLVHIRDPGQVR